MTRKTTQPLREQLHTEQCEHPVYEADEPRGILGWPEWAERKSKTHKQQKCPHCGLFAIWVTKEIRNG